MLWLLGEFPEPPRRVLDLGCEAGVLMLALAEIWPDTEFVGVDREPNAISVAKELTTRAASRSCRFLVGDLKSLSNESLGQFDLVLATTVFHEVLDELTSEEYASRDIQLFSISDTPPLESSCAEPLRHLNGLVRGEGCLAALNRWHGPERPLQWVQLMENVGWQVDLVRSYLLTVEDKYLENESMPITVHRPVANPVRCEPADILALHAYPDFKNRERFLFQGPAAEGVRLSFGPAERIMGVEFEYLNGSGIERAELIAAGGSLAIYRTSSHGFRELTLGALPYFPAYAEFLIELARDRAGACTVRGLEGSPSARWELYGLSEAADGLQEILNQSIK